MVLFPDARRAVAEADAAVPMWAERYDIAAARADTLRLAAEEPREEVAEVRDVDADGVRCRLYRPLHDPEAVGLIVHLHGGGFVFNDIDVHDATCRRFANRAGIPVLSVDYRCAPEHPFPAARDDVDKALAWIDRQDDLAGPTYVHGDSAGGNLALVAALRHPGTFRAVVLIYPFLDPRAGFDSYRTAADGFSQDEAAWYWQQYAATPADLEHPDLAPLRSDRLATLPPTLLVTAEHDPLRDEGEHLAAHLAELGVEVVATRYLGQVHGFWRHRVYAASDALIRQVAGFLAGHR